MVSELICSQAMSQIGSTESAPSLNNYGSLPMSSSTISATPTIGHVVNIKLTCNTYLLWKAQMMPCLHSQHLLGYVDRSALCPERMVKESTSTSTTQVPNPEYQHWVQKDQLVVLSQVLFLNTSHVVWSSLELAPCNLNSNYQQYK